MTRPTAVGVTGSPGAPDIDQAIQLRQLLAAFLEAGAQQLYHGDCVGADEAAATVAQELGWSPPRARIVALPSVDDTYRAFAPAHVTAEPDTNLARNRSMVAMIDHLIAVPDHRFSTEGKWQSGQGGTRYTTLHALQNEVTVTMIWPGGLVERIR